jgi:hypothetical protein
MRPEQPALGLCSGHLEIHTSAGDADIILREALRVSMKARLAIAPEGTRSGRHYSKAAGNGALPSLVAHMLVAYLGRMFWEEYPRLNRRFRSGEDGVRCNMRGTAHPRRTQQNDRGSCTRLPHYYRSYGDTTPSGKTQQDIWNF